MHTELEGHNTVWQARNLYLTILLGFLFTSNYCVCQVLAQGSNNVLQGSVKEQNYLAPPKSPSLNLKDLNNARDKFGSSPGMSMPSVGESFEPPPDAFNLNASKGDQIPNANPPGLAQPASPSFTGEQIVPGLDNSQFNQPPQQSNMVAEITNDPDSSPEMQLAWDEWHKRVAAAIYNKFNAIAQMAFKYSKSLACYVTYSVTKDGQVVNVSMSQQSPNVAFNAMVLLVINSISGQTDLLRYPDGSRRTVVNKAGMFTQNYGVQGFKYTTGDRETIPGR